MDDIFNIYHDLYIYIYMVTKTVLVFVPRVDSGK